MDEQRRLALTGLAAGVIAPTTGAKPTWPAADRSTRGSATTDDRVRLYFEEAGSGVPIIFIHEYAGDHRSWEPQVRFLSR